MQNNLTTASASLAFTWLTYAYRKWRAVAMAIITFYITYGCVCVCLCAFKSAFILSDYIKLAGFLSIYLEMVCSAFFLGLRHNH